MKIQQIVLAYSLFQAAVGVTSARETNEFQCGMAEMAEEVNLSSFNFSTIAIGPSCKDHHCTFLFPEEINWHIYPLPAGTTPKHSIFPSGLLEPRIDGDVLKYDKQNILEGDYKKGQNMQAGVNLYVPINQLKTINIFGVEQTVEVSTANNASLSFAGLDPLRISNTGVENHVLVTSPDWKIDFVEVGVDNIADLVVASGSVVDISGVDSKANIKCPEGLTLKTAGVDNDVFIEGKSLSIRMEGVDGDIEISDNGSQASPCANIIKSGVDNECETTYDTFLMGSATCLADTEASYGGCNWSLSTGAAIGGGIVIFVLLSAAIGACIYCCVACDRKEKCANKVADVTQHGMVVGKEMDDATHATIVEADVVDMKSEINTTDEKMKEVDLEKATVM